MKVKFWGEILKISRKLQNHFRSSLGVFRDIIEEIWKVKSKKIEVKLLLYESSRQKLG